MHHNKTVILILANNILLAVKWSHDILSCKSFQDVKQQSSKIWICGIGFNRCYLMNFLPNIRIDNTNEKKDI